MSDKSAYEQKLDAQLAEWQADIDKLKAKIDKAGADGRLEYRKAVEELEAKRREAGRKAEEIKAAGEHALADLKTGFDRLQDDFRERLRQTTRQLG